MPGSFRWPGCSRDDGAESGVGRSRRQGLQGDGQVQARRHRRLARLLDSVREELIKPLAEIFRERAPDHIEHELATGLLAEYAADRPDFLVDVMLDADPRAFSRLFDVIQVNRTAALAYFHSELKGLRYASNPPGLVAPAAANEGHQPSEGDPAAARRSARRGRAAVALVRLGDDTKVWELLEHSKDPEVRSHLINALAPYGADPRSSSGRSNDRARAGGRPRRRTPTSSTG